MSHRYGKLLTCDRCGYKEFVRALSDIIINGAYYSGQNKFEKTKEPWGYEDRRDLCPKCLKRYEEKKSEFWEEA